MDKVSLGSVLLFSAEKAHELERTRLYPIRFLEGEPKEFSSVGGFLQNGESLLECALRDREILERDEVSYRTIAKKLSDLVESSVDQKKYKVESEATKGMQTCPFSRTNDPDYFGSNCCGNDNRDIEITNIETEASISFGGLLIHLIGEHHFFEGEVDYRLDPKRVIEVLELKPEPDFNLAPISPDALEVQKQLLLNSQFDSLLPINNQLENFEESSGSYGWFNDLCSGISCFLNGVFDFFAKCFCCQSSM